MPARLYLQGTQHIVDTSQLCLFAIDGCRPSGIIDLRKDHNAALATLYGICQLVGLVLVECDTAQGVLLRAVAQHVGKLLVGHCLTTQGQMPEGINLLVGIVHIVGLVHFVLSMFSTGMMLSPGN